MHLVSSTHCQNSVFACKQHGNAVFARKRGLDYYYGDHLGSSSYIKDVNGDATQPMEYLPFGEDFISDQNATSYYTPYTFSAKERDLERRSIREDLKKNNQPEQTQYSYFGVRYGVYPERRRSRRDAGLSIWLSVDPMSDERPSLSAYNYCQWNPVMRIDPTGMLDGETDGNGSGSGTPQNQNPTEKPKLPAPLPAAPPAQDGTTVTPLNIKPIKPGENSVPSAENLAFVDPVAALLGVAEIATKSNPNVSNVVGVARTAVGHTATAVGVVSLMSDYQKTKLPQGNPNRVSDARLAYNTTSFVSSTVTGAAVGGPAGAVVGTVVGGAFWAADQMFQGAMWGIGEISNGIAKFENSLNNGWRPGGF